jgi:succinyl-CoA---D-citramalate CoA-transferase
MSDGPLAGVRVLELGTLIAAPFATRILGDFGADVIKVESPGEGDPLRTWGRIPDQLALWFAVQARNKRSVTLDLRQPEGQEAVRRLARVSDVVVENFRPGRLEGWGLGYEQLKAENPRLVMVRISGFGQTGPYRHRPGFGNIAECMGGLRYITGYPDQPPVRLGMSIADHIAALYGVIGALMALRRSEREGQGQVVDVALTESVFSFLEGILPEYGATGRVRERSGNDLHNAAPSGAYQTADGVWMAISGNGDSIFVRLMRAIGRPDPAEAPDLQSNPGRVRRVRELDAAIGAWAAARPADEVSAALDRAEVPCGPVYSVRDIAADPQYQARDIILDVPDPRYGRVSHPGVVPKLTETPGAVRHAGPELGADTAAVLRELAGYSEAELAALRERGIV